MPGVNSATGITRNVVGVFFSPDWIRGCLFDGRRCLPGLHSCWGPTDALPNRRQLSAPREHQSCRQLPRRWTSLAGSLLAPWLAYSTDQYRSAQSFRLAANNAASDRLPPLPPTGRAGSVVRTVRSLRNNRRDGTDERFAGATSRCGYSTTGNHADRRTSAFQPDHSVEACR